MTHRASTLALRQNPQYWANRIVGVEESIRHAVAPAYKKKLLKKLDTLKRRYAETAGGKWGDAAS